jgi:hypothetical protein
MYLDELFRTPRLSPILAIPYFPFFIIPRKTQVSSDLPAQELSVRVLSALGHKIELMHWNSSWATHNGAMSTRLAIQQQQRSDDCSAA